MTPLLVREIVYLKNVDCLFFISYYGKNIVSGTLVSFTGEKASRIISIEIYSKHIKELLKKDQLITLIQEINLNLLPPHIIIQEYEHQSDIIDEL